ncbi:hypothetical protein EMIT0P43_120198 [Pseudomonas jessenii]
MSPGQAQHQAGYPSHSSGYQVLIVGVGPVSDGCRASDTARNKKARTGRASLVSQLVEPGGFEPPSASTPLSVLHA